MKVTGAFFRQVLNRKYQIQQEGPHFETEAELRRPLRRSRICAHKYRRSSGNATVSTREAFAVAERQVRSIVIQKGLMGGNPCIKGTRIPVYMILDGIEYYGNLKGVLKSYPQLTAQQVKDAVRFSKIAMESSA
jgi:uncharacterized protein (DUF433 family)